MLTTSSADLGNLPHIVMTSSALWNLFLPSSMAMEEMYKVSSMNSHQGDANFITDMNLPCMIAAVNMFNTMFHHTLTLELSHDQDDLHNCLIAQVHIKLDPPTTSADARAEAYCTVTPKDVWALPPNDLAQSRTRQLLEAFDAMIKEKLLESSPKSEEFPIIPDGLFDEDDDEALDPAEPDMCAYKADNYTLEELDEYLTASVVMLLGGESI